MTRQTVLSFFTSIDPYVLGSVIFGVGLLTQPLEASAGQIRRTQVTCHPVGRVILSQDPGISNGTEICARDSLTVAQGARVDLLCPQSGRLHKLLAGQYSATSLCHDTRRKIRRCHVNTRLLCQAPRAQVSIEPRIRSLYGDTFIRPPKLLKWQALPDTQYYRVFIEGESQLRTFEVQTTSLNLEQHSVAFKPASTYLVTIAAYQDQKLVGESAVAVNLISPALHASLQTYIDEIRQFDLSLSEQVTLMDGVYMSENLLHQTIEMLEHYLGKTQSGNLQLLLGDRYWQADRLDLAQSSYAKAIVQGQRLSQPKLVRDAQLRIAIIQGELSSNDLIE